MDKSSKNTTLLFLFCLILFFAQIPSAVGESQQIDHSQEEKPPLINTLHRTISLLKHSQQSSWEKIKTALHEIQFRYFPPNLDFRGSDEENHVDMADAGGKMKNAAGSSFETSKELIKGSAKSASEVLGRTMHKTAEKGRQVSVSKEKSDAEL